MVRFMRPNGSIASSSSRIYLTLTALHSLDHIVINRRRFKSWNGTIFLANEIARWAVHVIASNYYDNNFTRYTLSFGLIRKFSAVNDIQFVPCLVLRH